MEEASLTLATWCWLLIPMPLVIILSIITLFTDKEDN